MSSPDRPVKPSDAELAALDKRVEKLLADLDAAPRSNRIRLTSDKFSGPVAETVIGRG